MRIAILADIHGNLPALEAAVAALHRLHIDRLVIAGDVVVGAPDSLACWERIKAIGCPVLRGNHERYVVDLGTERAPPEWSTPQFGPVQFAAEQLGETARRELAVLPATLRLPEAPDLLIVHGSARNDHDQVFKNTTDAELAAMFAGTTERCIVRGHNHGYSLRPWGHRCIITAGSVGLPLDGNPAAQFVVWYEKEGKWQLERHAIPYDVDATLRRFRETGYVEKAGPMARLYEREVATAEFHVVPFLKFQQELRRRGEEVSLDDAVERFLSERRA
jgi:predicted phosphodiesterase